MYKLRQEGKRYNCGIRNGEHMLFLYRMSDQPITKYRSKTHPHPYLTGTSIAVRTLSCAYSNIWRPQTVAMRESRMTRNCHVRFGERSRETHLSQGRKVRSAPTLLSPILANIYLNKLDKYIEKTLLPKHNRGEGRVWSSEYMRIYNRMRRSKKSGNVEKYQEHRRQLQQLPSLDTTDPNFRRLRYIRYADDVRHLTGC